jgi:hypothetical protein
MMTSSTCVKIPNVKKFRCSFLVDLTILRKQLIKFNRNVALIKG